MPPVPQVRKRPRKKHKTPLRLTLGGICWLLLATATQIRLHLADYWETRKERRRQRNSSADHLE